MYAKIERILSAFDIHEREMLLRGAIVRHSTAPNLPILEALMQEVETYTNFKRKVAEGCGNA